MVPLMLPLMVIDGLHTWISPSIAFWMAVVLISGWATKWLMVVFATGFFRWVCFRASGPIKFNF